MFGYIRVPHHPLRQGVYPGVCGTLWPRGPATGVGHQQAVHHPGPQDGQEAAQGLHELQQLEGQMAIKIIFFLKTKFQNLHNPNQKPWLYPEQISSKRIVISDCIQ